MKTLCFRVGCRAASSSKHFSALWFAGDEAVQRVTVNFTATGRNVPAQQVLLAMGFEEIGDKNRICLDLRTLELACDFIHVDCESYAECGQVITSAGACAIDRR